MILLHFKKFKLIRKSVIWKKLSDSGRARHSASFGYPHDPYQKIKIEKIEKYILFNENLYSWISLRWNRCFNEIQRLYFDVKILVKFKKHVRTSLNEVYTYLLVVEIFNDVKLDKYFVQRSSDMFFELNLLFYIKI